MHENTTQNLLVLLPIELEGPPWEPNKTEKHKATSIPNPGEPPFYGLANATRVAFTLIYAGVKNVAILDGGYPKWVAEGRPTDTDGTTPAEVVYEGTVNNGIIASLNYVRWQLHKADLIDARDADVYFGVTIEPFADKAGHIPAHHLYPHPGSGI